MARATNDVREINLAFNPGVNLVVGSMFFMIAPFFLVPSLNPQLLLMPSPYMPSFIFLLCGITSSGCVPPPSGAPQLWGNSTRPWPRP
jgi:hypothetical protein